MSNLRWSHPHLGMAPLRHVAWTSFGSTLRIYYGCFDGCINRGDSNGAKKVIREVEK